MHIPKLHISQIGLEFVTTVQIDLAGLAYSGSDPVLANGTENVATNIAQIVTADNGFIHSVDLIFLEQPSFTNEFGTQNLNIGIGYSDTSGSQSGSLRGSNTGTLITVNSFTHNGQKQSASSFNLAYGTDNALSGSGSGYPRYLYILAGGPVYNGTLTSGKIVVKLCGYNFCQYNF